MLFLDNDLKNKTFQTHLDLNKKVIVPFKCLQYFAMSLL